MKIHCSFIFTFLLLLGVGCSGDAVTDKGDRNPPLVVLISIADGETGVETSAKIFVEYHEPIQLDESFEITVNGVAAESTVSGNVLNISAELVENKTYTVFISSGSIKDMAGNFARELTFSFETKNSTIFEAEEAVLSAGLKTYNITSGYSGTGYVGKFTSPDDYIKFNLSGITKGNYDLFVGYSTSGWGGKKCRILVNESWGVTELPPSNGFKKQKYARVKLKEGENEIIITPDYTWFIIDYIQLLPNQEPELPFNIDATLVTPNPSGEAVNLYNFLKDNFQSNIISGTMANHNTNIVEAEWVNEQTGKWPALIGLDFIDYTRQWHWVNYTELVSNAKQWWDNNGIVTIMWHWRDPSRITDEFYTNETNFDITKIYDENSDEYRAMMEDIDVIAEYLKELKDYNMPVLWRPMHEASGGWFWWGARGPESCKTLWRVMFDRLVNHHGMNNLIWVWTTGTGSGDPEWYPGDEYVDILGLDIYPGENQHGSQYTGFEKIKELFNGKKLIALTECGSVPDPELMMEYGDTWSWFMPWNGDFTRNDKHNGTEWWLRYFSYDYVFTRDKMQDLK